LTKKKSYVSVRDRRNDWNGVLGNKKGKDGFTMETRKVKAKPLSLEAFKDYGTYADMMNPRGYYLEGEYHKFYRDRIRFPATPQTFCCSSLTVRKNEEFIVKGMEYHDYTAEIQMPMDADVVLVCAPPNGGEIAAREAEAFLIPKGTMVCLHPGTWHDVLYPVDSEQASILIGLPERIYHNDIVVKNFEDCVVQVEF
jgi:ureidoglycolate hydrolase